MAELSPGEIDYTEFSFPDPPPDRPFVAINMVMSADGRTVVDGTERGLGSKLDQRLMRELRVHFDVVMNGGATFRASGTSARLNDPELEQWRLDRGMSASPIAAVLTRSGDLPPERRFFTDDGCEAVIYLSSAAPDAVRRELESRGRPVVSVPEDSGAVAALDHMKRTLGASRVLVEGGATLNGELIRLGPGRRVLPHAGGRGSRAEILRIPPCSGPGSRPATGIRQMTLIHAKPTETGELFLRYRVEQVRD